MNHFKALGQIGLTKDAGVRSTIDNLWNTGRDLFGQARQAGSNAIDGAWNSTVKPVIDTAQAAGTAVSQATQGLGQRISGTLGSPLHAAIQGFQGAAQSDGTLGGVAQGLVDGVGRGLNYAADQANQGTQQIVNAGNQFANTAMQAASQTPLGRVVTNPAVQNFAGQAGQALTNAGQTIANTAQGAVNGAVAGAMGDAQMNKTIGEAAQPEQRYLNRLSPAQMQQYGANRVTQDHGGAPPRATPVPEQPPVNPAATPAAVSNPAAPSAQHLQQFSRIGGYNPQSALDRAKMQRLMAGEKNWSDNAAARAMMGKSAAISASAILAGLKGLGRGAGSLLRRAQNLSPKQALGYGAGGLGALGLGKAIADGKITTLINGVPIPTAMADRMPSFMVNPWLNGRHSPDEQPHGAVTGDIHSPNRGMPLGPAGFGPGHPMAKDASKATGLAGILQKVLLSKGQKMQSKVDKAVDGYLARNPDRVDMDRSVIAKDYFGLEDTNKLSQILSRMGRGLDKDVGDVINSAAATGGLGATILGVNALSKDASKATGLASVVQKGLASAGKLLGRSGAKAKVQAGKTAVQGARTVDPLSPGGKQLAREAGEAVGNTRVGTGKSLKSMAKGIDESEGVQKAINYGGGGLLGTGLLAGSNRLGYSSGKSDGTAEGYDQGAIDAARAAAAQQGDQGILARLANVFTGGGANNLEGATLSAIAADRERRLREIMNA